MRERSPYRAVVLRERERSNRTNEPFTLILFTARTIEDIRSRIRSTDQAFRLSKRGVAVVLPNTNLEQALDFVVGFDQSDSVAYEIYTYPDHWDGDLTSRGIPIWKRALDIVGSLVLLLLFSPAIAFMAACIKLVSPGPLIYRSTRVGYRGKRFAFYKFRTMKCEELKQTHEAPHRAHSTDFIRNGDKPMTKLDTHDTRIFFGGGVLRKSGLDELPQLINILKGDMSLVGPRPCVPYEAAEYLKWHKTRFDIVPGLSGLWQVSGKNKLSFRRMIRLDIRYADRLSLWLDLWILLRTVYVLVAQVIEASGVAMMRRYGERRNRRNRRDRRANAARARQDTRRRADLNLIEDGTSTETDHPGDQRSATGRRSATDRREAESGSD